MQSENLSHRPPPKLPQSNFSNFVVKLDKVLYFFESNIALWCFIIMGIAVIYGIIVRFVFRSINQYGEEISRYALVFAAFMGVSINVRIRGHLAVDLFVDKLPAVAKKSIKIFTDLVSIFTFGFLTYLSIQFIITQLAVVQISSAMHIPMYVVYFTFLLGFAISTLRSIMLLWNDHFAKEKILNFSDVSILEDKED